MDAKDNDADGGRGRFGGGEERTAVIVPRFDRGDVSRGLQKLATAFGGFRGSLFRGADFLNEGTALGYSSLTDAEAEDIEDLLEGIEHRIRGVRAVLKRAVGPAPTSDP